MSSPTSHPYPAGTTWMFSALRNNYPEVRELVLHWEPAAERQFTDHDPKKTPAVDLWREWATFMADRLHDERPGQFRPGDVHITWSIRTPEGDGIAEYAPHLFPDPTVESLAHDENFLTYYTHPVHSATGERVNWLRLPVSDRHWNTGGTDSGRGFVQDAIGWKPGPLQPVMNVHQLAAAAGIQL
ncbi:hypothetical protein [Kitasatospora sp. NPDC056531]|uniref:hypothetical protein n=1 Tax=Kitasatospora sp. NPDC056531 TaxID=3345856 RepID=UPI0036A4B50E